MGPLDWHDGPNTVVGSSWLCVSRLVWTGGSRKVLKCLNIVQLVPNANTRRLHLSLDEILPHGFEFGLGRSENDHSSFVFRQSRKSARQVGKQRAASGHGRTAVTRRCVRPIANYQPEFGIWNGENAYNYTHTGRSLYTRNVNSLE